MGGGGSSQIGQGGRQINFIRRLQIKKIALDGVISYADIFFCVFTNSGILIGTYFIAFNVFIFYNLTNLSFHTLLSTFIFLAQ